MKHPRSTPLLRRWLIGLALSAVVALQWLALVHSTAGHGRARAPAVESVAGAAWQGVQSLVAAHDDGSLVCQLLEHCLHGGHTGSAALVLSHAAPQPAVFPALGAVLVAARWAGHRARAPPVLV